jgi:hypothetical protein
VRMIVTIRASLAGHAIARSRGIRGAAHCPFDSLPTPFRWASAAPRLRGETWRRAERAIVDVSKLTIFERALDNRQLYGNPD